MWQSGVVVKAFDGSMKTVIGEVELPIKIGPSDFQITFQVMDIQPSYTVRWADHGFTRQAP